ncbi:MAG: HD domain-containing protein [Desulfobacterales bacterium]|nr:HD domain-containing protein [Desulfobacterales bacterium]
MEPDFHSYFKLFARISKKIHANNDTREILTTIVENITTALEAKGCIYWILDTRSRRIETRIFHGFDYRSLLKVDYPDLMTIFKERQSDHVQILDARANSDIPDLERLGKRKINAITGMFFDITGPYTGLLAVYFMGNRSLTGAETELVEALGEQGALALEKAIGYDEKMLAMYREIVEGFALAIEARDAVTHGHSRRVAALSRVTARTLGLPKGEVNTIFHAAILHDIGKIGAQDQVLERLGKLNAREMDQIKRHPDLGADILAPLSFFCDMAPLVRNHHERFDGRGYPSGISGEEIPLGARIITVCDALETLLSGRPHMPRKDLPSAIREIQEGVGTRFDPRVVQALFKGIRENPDALNTKESIEDCMELLRRNMADLAAQKSLEKKLASPFPAGF